MSEDVTQEKPKLFLVDGDLCPEKAAAGKVVRWVEMLNDVLCEAWEQGLDVTLIHGKQEIKLKHGLLARVTLEIV